ncbi:hypothetical protein LUZ63_008367 [Rhynchospora breviuscula]|uniref:Uncharacterized protein n=1 Tax=Rhynchospora breviuscula TaxID=2022672 RepID=A0A9Q0HVX3_9POAL|nr:hypothetical protein LUZ63_008367 [Rhynchospora breviuscula]
MEKMVVADLGCSSGPNTFILLIELMKIIGKQCERLGVQQPEMQFFLNDLPKNDFNTLFQSLDDFEEKLRAEKYAVNVPHFVAGLAGSFYERLFPSQSVQFFHSSYSLHWISQDQFKRDFSLFLKLRFKEVVPGGQMVLSFLGRKEKDIYDGELSSSWGLVSESLNSMVLEGLVEEEKLDSFNLPFYAPSMEEAKEVVSQRRNFGPISEPFRELGSEIC